VPGSGIYAFGGQYGGVLGEALGSLPGNCCGYFYGPDPNISPLGDGLLFGDNKIYLREYLRGGPALDQYGLILSTSASSPDEPPPTPFEISFDFDRRTYVLKADRGGILDIYDGDFSILSYIAVPEAGTWTMMLIGFGVIGVATRTKFRRHVA